MTANVATDPFSHQSRHPFSPGITHGVFMAGSMTGSTDPVAISNPASTSILASPPAPIAFLKTSSAKPESHLTSIASAGLRTSPSPGLEASQPTLSPRMATSSHVVSADQAAELEKDRAAPPPSSPQVAREALGAAIGVDPNLDAPTQDPAKAANTLSEPMDTVARSLQIASDDMQVDAHPSPGTMGDAFGSGSRPTTSATLMNTSTVASPGPIEETGSHDGDRVRVPNEHVELTEDASKAFSYPMPTVSMNDPRRGASLPHSGFHKGSPRSPSTKKHRCPYCATEFTRHHNLKSHLLTHSQEKPYVCQTCQSRFRRLHDLKRHTKLHTGERPHICPKCGRRFARGDALARHNKGQGGCAGRRSSMGSYAGEDDYGDAGPGGEDAMDGLMYTEPERMDEEDERHLHMPSIRKHNAPSTEPNPRAGATFQPRGPSTYPPIAASRPPPPGGLFPPPTSLGGSSSSTSPTSQTGTLNFALAAHSSASSFPAPIMTESPNAMSPNALASKQLGHGPEAGSIHSHQQHRAHSPSLSQPYPQPHYTRTGPAQGSLGLPPPQPGAPQLPLPPGLNPSESRYSFHSQATAQAGPPSALAANHGATHSHGTSALAQGGGESGQPGSYSSAIDPTGPAEQSREDKLWTYIRAVHEEVGVLRTEVVALRAQLAAAQAAGSTAAAPSQSLSAESGSDPR
jgi:hypothetical protein